MQLASGRRAQSSLAAHMHPLAALTNARTRPLSHPPPPTTLTTHTHTHTSLTDRPGPLSLAFAAPWSMGYGRGAATAPHAQHSRPRTRCEQCARQPRWRRPILAPLPPPPIPASHIAATMRTVSHRVRLPRPTHRAGRYAQEWAPQLVGESGQASFGPKRWL